MEICFGEFWNFKSFVSDSYLKKTDSKITSKCLLKNKDSDDLGCLLLYLSYVCGSFPCSHNSFYLDNIYLAVVCYLNCSAKRKHKLEWLTRMSYIYPQGQCWLSWGSGLKRAVIHCLHVRGHLYEVETSWTPVFHSLILSIWLAYLLLHKQLRMLAQHIPV